MLPNFFVLGTQKGGTTTLHHWLCGHPDIYLPEQKETKFFAREREWNKGIEFYEQEYFANCNQERAVGEIDPDYMYYEPVWERIQSVYEDVSHLKFIFVLRDPAERAFSHYLMTHRRGYELLPFEQAIASEADRITGDFDEKMHFSYTGRGFYYKQIKPFLAAVGQDNILVLFSEDLTADPDSVLKQIYKFLAVDEHYRPDSINQRFHEATKPRYPHMRIFLDNVGFLKKAFRLLFPFVGLRRFFKEKLLEWNEQGSFDEKPKLQDSTRQQLNSLFKEDIAQIEQLTGRDLSHWK